MEEDPWADAPSSPQPRLSSDSFHTNHAESSSTKPSPVRPVRSSLRHSGVPSISQAEDAEVPRGSTEQGDVEEDQSRSSLIESSSSTIKIEEKAAPTINLEPPPTREEDGFDDFDDFDTPAAGPSSGSVPLQNTTEDDFGDFGDFEEGDFEDTSIQPEVVKDKLETLRLNPFPSREDLIDQLSSVLSPLVASSSSTFTDEPIRQIGNIRQILVAESSRDAYAQMTTPPMLKTLDWTRSRVRREHLISMGVPVNLDEVDSHRLTALPPLRITTSSMPPPRPRKAATIDVPPSNGHSSSSSVSKGKQRDPSPQTQSTHPAEGKYGLGQRPELDLEKVERLCGVEEEGLSILPLAKLRELQDDLVETSASASGLLAWLLQLKDAQNQDSATYNGMISELIANAAKAKQAQTVASSGGGVFRRASQRRPASGIGSGGNTPGRVGSPAV